MTDQLNEDILRHVNKKLTEKLSLDLMKKIELRTQGNSVEIETKFGKPHLDVDILVEQGEFIASYSNGYYGEHWYKKDALSTAIASDISDIILDLIFKGATQNDTYVGKQLVSSTTKIGNSESTTTRLKFKLLGIRRKKSIFYEPPVN